MTGRRVIFVALLSLAAVLNLVFIASFFRASGRAREPAMTVDEVVDQFDPWLKRQARTAWRPIVQPGQPPSATSSGFGGLPWLAEHESWPLCGACHRKMHFFLQLDLATLPPELGSKHGRGLLQFFYCMHDCDRHAWEPFDSGHLLRIVAPAAGAPTVLAPSDVEVYPAKAITGWERVKDLPHPQEHEDLGLRCDYNFDAKTVQIECEELGLRVGPLPMSQTNADGLEVAEALGNCVTGDKLGGWPYWVQGAEYPLCPKCGKRTEILFQIDSEDNLPIMFGDAGCGHIMQCPNHRDVLAFGWACS
jgi:uncharacterized protein YwqG